MRKFINSAEYSIYRWVHTTGIVADVIYAWTFYVYKILFRIAYWRASFRQVTLEQISKARRIDPSGALTTGVTTTCNAKCIFCAYPRAIQNKTLKTGTMQMDVFTKAVDEWASLGGKSLCLTPVVGEPLVDPGLFEKINYAVNKAKMTNVWLVTNGILLKRDDNYKRLIDSGIHSIHISTQGSDKETYEKVYGVNHYDQVMSGIKDLLEYNHSKQEPVSIYVRFRNAQKPSEIIASVDFKKYIKPYLSQKVRINFSVDYDNWGGVITEKDMLGFMRLRKLPPKINLPCKILFSYAIRHDGSVRLCGCRFVRADHDDLVVGNINTETLESISQGDNAWKIIQGFYFGNRPETCKGCTMYTPINQNWIRNRSQK
jgi:MoaA/NifB/PqqE/SkfB family radical SAM enzyme